jgi:DNA relaxase NicK
VQNSGTSTIDWGGYTLPEEVDPRILWEDGPVIEFEPTPSKGRYGYAFVHQWQNVELWTHHHNAGPHIDASGKGCADLAHAATERGEWKGWPEWLAWQLGRGAKFSRLDLAIDIVGGALDLDALAEAIRQGNLVSQWEAENWTQTKGIVPGGKGGNTIYGGSKSSSSRLCMYDKKAEQGQPDDAPSWVRVEFRARHEVAVALSKAIGKGGMASGLKTVMHYARFTTPAGATLPEWAAALNGAVAQPLAVQKRGGTYESMANWLETSVAASLAALVDANDADWDYLLQLVEEGRRKYNAKKRTMITERKYELKRRDLTGMV